MSELAFSPDGQRLAAVGMSPDVTAWNWPDKNVAALIEVPLEASNNSLLFIPGTSELVLKTSTPRLPIYKLKR